MVCQYRSPDGALCNRENLTGRENCLFHQTTDHRIDFAIFQSRLNELIQAKNGDWRGFRFPSTTYIRELKIDFPLDIRWADFENLEIQNVDFSEKVDFSYARFKGELSIRDTHFRADTLFNFCRFTQLTELLKVSFHENCSFKRAEFSERTLLKTRFIKRAGFEEAIFRKSLHLTGWRDITLQLSAILPTATVFGAIINPTETSLLQRTQILIQRIYHFLKIRLTIVHHKSIAVVARIKHQFVAFRHQYAKNDPRVSQIKVFESEGSFEQTEFATPNQVTFTQVDLSRVYFRGTNLRGARFVGVTWWQEEIGRNGLHDDFFISRSKDGPFRHEFLPALEETYRNIRVALEENRSYVEAADFYYGEMEARRTHKSFLKRNLFSIEALYLAASKYGTSIFRATMILATLIFFHLWVTATINGGEMENISALLLRSLRLILFQDGTADVTLIAAQQWADTVFRILAITQVTLIVFAFRSRIKRH